MKIKKEHGFIELDGHWDSVGSGDLGIVIRFRPSQLSSLVYGKKSKWLTVNVQGHADVISCSEKELDKLKKLLR